MAKHKSCIHCSKAATIHLTQIVENKITKIDLCEECAHLQGLTNPEGLDIHSLLAGGALHSLPSSLDGGDYEASDVSICSISGATFEDFKKTGRLGSAESYNLFQDKLKPILKNMHRGTRHVGKVPSTFVSFKKAESIHDLQKKLVEAIREERFEEAALLRDAIKASQQDTEKSANSGESSNYTA